MINLLDRYDLLEDDIQWLNKYNAQVKTNKLPPPVISEDDMEKCIDMFEREAGKITLVRRTAIHETGRIWVRAMD